MDRHRGERSGSNPEHHHIRHSRMHSRFSDGPISHRNPNNYRGGFSGGGHHHHHHSYNSPPRSHHHPPFNSSPNRPIDGDGFRPMTDSGFDSGHPMPLSGQKRGYSFSGRGRSPDHTDGSGFAKLFIGSVPRTATEEDVRPLFEEHGNVIEVAFIKDKRTGQQQVCCFIKYASSLEAERAIKALHNQHTLPGGMGPIQVRFADGERERLGAVDCKLFVGSMNKLATEQEIEEIFSLYGRVEDVYLMRDEMRQSRGCGFIKYSHRDMAVAAINALNGIYVMRGCDQPLIVRFADPKRPRAGDRGGDSRFAPAFGGPGVGNRSQAPGVRPAPNFGDSMGWHDPPRTWHPMSPESRGASSQAGTQGFGSHLVPRNGIGAMSSPPGGPVGVLGGPVNGSRPVPANLPSSTAQQSFIPSLSQAQPAGQQISPLQKPFQSPQNLPPSLQLHPQPAPSSYSQTQTPHSSMHQFGQMQNPRPAGQPSFSQTLPSQGQFPSSQSQIQRSTSAAMQQIPSNLQPHAASVLGSQQQLLAPTNLQQVVQPVRQQSPSQFAQMLSQQTQNLQASFQSSQQAFSELQQQLHLMQPSQSLTQQQSSQAPKLQSPWTGVLPQTSASTPVAAPSAVAPSTTASARTVSVTAQMTAPVSCNWTEHTSPDGYKYYYNSVTCESRWEKPEEWTLIEQQQRQQQQPKLSMPQLQPHIHPHVLSAQQVPQAQLHLQTQLRPQQQIQQPYVSTVAVNQNVQEIGYAQIQAAANSGIEPGRFQQGLQSAQESTWKNKPAAGAYVEK